jgi:translocation and assembly module TamA
VGVAARPRFDEIKVGAGIGVRYYTSFGPLRLDVAVPLNPGPNDPDFGVYVALGHSF